MSTENMVAFGVLFLWLAFMWVLTSFKAKAPCCEGEHTPDWATVTYGDTFADFEGRRYFSLSYTCVKCQFRVTDTRVGLQRHR